MPARSQWNAARAAEIIASEAGREGPLLPILHALQASEVLPAGVLPAPAMPLSVDRLEWEHIQRVLAEHGGNISATARALQMHRRTLQRKLARPPWA